MAGEVVKPFRRLVRVVLSGSRLRSVQHHDALLLRRADGGLVGFDGGVGGSFHVVHLGLWFANASMPQGISFKDIRLGCFCGVGGGEAREKKGR